MKTAKVKREISEEMDLLDTMLYKFVKLLQEKGIITREECEKHITEEVKRALRQVGEDVKS